MIDPVMNGPLPLFMLMVSFIWVTAAAQDSTYCDPTVFYGSRPIAIEATYARLMDYTIKSSGEGDLNLQFDGRIRRNARWKFNVRSPLYSRPGFKSNIGILYNTENYALSPRPVQDPQLLGLIEQRKLKQLQLSIGMLKPFIGNKFILVSLKGGLNYDGSLSRSKSGRAMKYSAFAVYGIKHNVRTSYGFGVAFSYDFGNASYYPVLAFTRSFNKDWGLELLLPAKVKGRKTFNDKNTLFCIFDVDGANYNIDIENALGLDGTYYLERSDLRGMLRYEREVYDFLWFHATAGVDFNLGLNLVSGFGVDRGDILVSNNVGRAPFVEIGLFVVPPRKMWTKMQTPEPQ